MRQNTAPKRAPVLTHEGGRAFPHLKPLQQLQRSVLSCLLWEREFYEDGEDIAARITRLAGEVAPSELAVLAVHARTQFKLRHVPLLLLAVLCRTGAGTRVPGDAIAATIQRADELAEFLAIYAKLNGVEPSGVANGLKAKLSQQAKRGLAEAFRKFDAYQLAKYDRAGAVRLRDALFLCHAKPRDNEQQILWQQLVNQTLPAPDTWEVALSGGADKAETFTRLLQEGRLGYLALLRNLRNMEQAGVDHLLIGKAILERKGADRVLPFRYVAAARAVPRYEPVLDTALQVAIQELPKLEGMTFVLVDVSGSMNGKLSAKSDLSRMDAAAALAAIMPVYPGQLRLFSFSDQLVEVPPRRGMVGIDAVTSSQAHSGTNLFGAVAKAQGLGPHARMVVITDEQAAGSPRPGMIRGGVMTRLPDPVPGSRGYVINVASAQNGVGYGPWTHIDGFSEQVLRFMVEHEAAR